MPAHLDNLNPAAIAALALPPGERCARIVRDRFINHEQILEIYKVTDMLVNAPRRTRARGLIVSGKGGSGKTALAGALLRRYPERNAVGRQNVLPISRITMTGARRASQIFTRILEALGVPHFQRYVGSSAEVMVLRCLTESGLRALIIDEIQDVLNGTAFQLRAALEAIKYIMNESGIAIIALGTEDAEEAMSREEHLRTRFRAMSLPIWSAGALLANFLSELERCLPLREPSRLSSLGMMKVLVKLSGGVLDAMLVLINTAATLAVEEGQERISEELIKRAEYELPMFYGALRSED